MYKRSTGKTKADSSPKELCKFDLVLTTYDNLGEVPSIYLSNLSERFAAARNSEDTSNLLRVHWLRVILDEAHVLRAAHSNTNKVCCELRADRRWAVTGTRMK